MGVGERTLEKMVDVMLNGLFNTLSDAYQGKRVFVTGHTGFKGAWLVAFLKLLGAEVKGYALAPETSNALFTMMRGEEWCTSVFADVRDSARLQHELIDFQPDFVFHLAAQPLVRLSYSHPLTTWNTNVMGTAHVLDALRQLDKKCVAVMITTDKVYENREWVYPYRENEALGGRDPYSASKAACELVIHSYRTSFFREDKINDHRKAIASARAGNVIGGGDWAMDRIIPDMVSAFTAATPLEVRNPNAVRPWQHVIEPLCGYLLLGRALVEQPLAFSEAWNFGPKVEDCLPVKDLVDIARSTWGSGEVTYPKFAHSLHEAALLKLDISKATDQLKWHPKYSARQAIQFTMQWYAAAHQGEDARELVMNDLNRYLYD